MDGFRLFSKKQRLLNEHESRIISSTMEPTATVASGKSQPADSSEKPTLKTFADLGLSPFLCDTLASVSMHQPTDIQRACVPPILNGVNVIGSAKTGSGKTAAFALPILQKISEDPYGIFALVLTPTRELAFQIAEQFKVLGEKIRLRQSVIVGGMGASLIDLPWNTVLLL